MAHQGKPVAACSASSSRAASATLGQAPSSAPSTGSAAPPLASSSTDCAPALSGSAGLAALGASTRELASLSSEVLLPNERRDAAVTQRVPVQCHWASSLTLRKVQASAKARSGEVVWSRHLAIMLLTHAAISDLWRQR